MGIRSRFASKGQRREVKQLAFFPFTKIYTSHLKSVAHYKTENGKHHGQYGHYIHHSSALAIHDQIPCLRPACAPFNAILTCIMLVTLDITPKITVNTKITTATHNAHQACLFRLSNQSCLVEACRAEFSASFKASKRAP
jgi:hypothetical protein